MSSEAPSSVVIRSTLRRASCGVKRFVEALDDFNKHSDNHCLNSNANINRPTTSTAQHKELFLASNSEAAEEIPVPVYFESNFFDHASNAFVKIDLVASIPMEYIPPLSDSDDSNNGKKF